MFKLGNTYNANCFWVLQIVILLQTEAVPRRWFEKYTKKNIFNTQKYMPGSATFKTLLDKIL